MSLHLDLETFRTVLENLPTGVYLVDRDRKILFWNHGAEQISGFLAQDVIGRYCPENILGHCNAEQCSVCKTHCPLQDTIRDGQPRQAELYLRHKEGHRVAVRVRAIPLRDQTGVVIGAAESFDVHRFVAGHDRPPNGPEAFDIFSRATGLPANSVTATVLKQNIDTFAERLVPLAILHIQIDRLNRFQADHGLEAADALLKVAATTMRNSLQPGDFLGCWSQNDFLAIIASRRRRTLERIAERVRSMVNSSGITWWGDRICPSISIGGAIVIPGDTIETLLQRADSALDECVEHGGNSIRIFTRDTVHGPKGNPCL